MGRTTLIIAHRLATTKNADRIALPLTNQKTNPREKQKSQLLQCRERKEGEMAFWGWQKFEH